MDLQDTGSDGIRVYIQLQVRWKVVIYVATNSINNNVNFLSV